MILIADKFDASGIETLSNLGHRVVCIPDLSPETLPAAIDEHIKAIMAKPTHDDEFWKARVRDHQGTAARVDAAINFMKACGIDGDKPPMLSTDCFTAHEALHLIGHGAKHGVSRGVAPCVVDLLEVVEIEDEASERARVATSPGELRREPVHEVALVVGTRQRVADGGVVELALDGLSAQEEEVRR